MEQNPNDQLQNKIITYFLSNIEFRNEKQLKLIQNLANESPEMILNTFLPLITEESQKSKIFIDKLKLFFEIFTNLQQSKLEIVIDQIGNFLSAQIKFFIEYEPPVEKAERDKEIEIIKQINEIIINSIKKLIKISQKDIAQLILQFFDAGKVPHKIVIDLLEVMNNNFGEGISEYSKELMPKFLSTCSMVKSQEGRLRYCRLMLEIYQNLILSQENKDTLNVDSLGDITMTLFQVINSEWMQSKDSQENKQQYICLLGIISKFLPRDFLQKQSENLVQEFIKQLKNPNALETEFPDSFNHFLERLKSDNLPYFEELIKSVVAHLYELYRQPIFSNNYPFDPIKFKIRNQLLHILQNLSLFNADNVLEFFIQKAQVPNTNEKISALWIINFVISRNYENTSYKAKKSLISSLQNLQFEKDFEIRFALLENIFSLCKNQTFLKDIKEDQSFECEFLFYYLIKHVSIHDDEIKDSLRQNQGSQEFTSDLKSLKNRAFQILSIITNEANSGVLIWPVMLEFITNQSFAPGLSSILKALSDYIQKFKESTGSYPEIDSKNKEKVPKINTVQVRLFILLKMPFFYDNLGLNILESLQNISEAYLSVPIQEDLVNQIQDLKFIIKSKQINRQYLEKLYLLWGSIIQVFSQQSKNQNEFLMNIHEDLTATINQYEKKPELYCHIMKLHAILLTKMQNKEMVKFQIDKFFSYIHTNYSNLQLNMNLNAQPITMELRLAVAESFGFVASSHFDLIIDKVRNIFNCEVIEKKKEGGFGSSLMGMFQKGQNNQEQLQDLQATLILVYGFVCKSIEYDILKQKIENSIINNVIGFLDKLEATIQSCVQKTIVLISQGLEKIQEEEKDKENDNTFILIEKYHQKFLDTSLRNFKSKNNSIKMDAWESITSLLKLKPLSYDKTYEFFNQCLSTLPIQNQNVTPELQKYSNHISLLIQTMIHHDFLKVDQIDTKKNNKDSQQQQQQQQLQQQQEQEKNNKEENKNEDNDNIDKEKSNETEEIIEEKEKRSYQLLNQIIQLFNDRYENDEITLVYFYQQIVDSLSNYKKPIQDQDKVYILQSASTLLKHNYKENSDLGNQTRLCLEKIFLGLKVFPDVKNNNVQQFNKDLVNQLSQNLNKKDFEDFIKNICEIQLKNQQNVKVIEGFLSLIEYFCQKYLEDFKKQSLKQLFSNLLLIFNNIKALKQSESVKENLNKILMENIVMVLFQKHLIECLEILGSESPIFPISDFQGKCLQMICTQKQLLFKTFNHLTDILNNPENYSGKKPQDIKVKNIGNLMTNYSIYIGYMIQDCTEIHALINKYFFQIFGTCLLRLSTCFEEQYQPEQQDDQQTSASKVALWTFETFINNTEKSDLEADFSQGLKLKLISEDMFKDGVQELIMITCKNSSILELESLLQFLKPFMRKKITRQRSVCFMVICQLIQSSHQMIGFNLLEGQKLKEYYYYLIETCLKHVNDNSENIRNYIYRGIGNLTYLIQFKVAVNEGKLQEIQEKFKIKQDQNQVNNKENSQNETKNTIIDVENWNDLQELDDDLIIPKFEITAELYTQIIETLFQGLDDSSEVCVRDSLNSLQNIVEFIDPEFLSDFSLNLLQKVSLNFEKDHPKLRMVAFNLYGKLIQSLIKSDKMEDYYENNLHYCLASLIIHLLDDNNSVRSICKVTLEKVLEIPQLNELKQCYLKCTGSNSEENGNINFNILDTDENFLINIVGCLFDNYQDYLQVYTVSLIEFSKSPNYNTKGASILCLLFWKSKIFQKCIELQKQQEENQEEQNQEQTEFYEDISNKIKETVENILENKETRGTELFILKGSQFLM